MARSWRPRLTLWEAALQRLCLEESRDGSISWEAVKLQMQQVCELVLVKASLGRLNVVSFQGYGVHTEAQRWQVILHSRSERFYTGC